MGNNFFLLRDYSTFAKNKQNDKESLDKEGLERIKIFGS